MAVVLSSSSSLPALLPSAPLLPCALSGSPAGGTSTPSSGLSRERTGEHRGPSDQGAVRPGTMLRAGTLQSRRGWPHLLKQPTCRPGSSAAPPLSAQRPIGTACQQARAHEGAEGASARRRPRGPERKQGTTPHRRHSRSPQCFQHHNQHHCHLVVPQVGAQLVRPGQTQNKVGDQQVVVEPGPFQHLGARESVRPGSMSKQGAQSSSRGWSAAMAAAAVPNNACTTP